MFIYYDSAGDSLTEAPEAILKVRVRVMLNYNDVKIRRHSRRFRRILRSRKRK